MSYLQLADSMDVNELYVTIPDGYGNTMRVREDYFDRFSDCDFDEIMDTLEPSMNGKAERKARREERKAARAEKKAGRGGAARRDARLARVQARQEGKTARAASGGGVGGVLDKIGGIAKNILGGVTGSAEVDGIDRSLDISYDNAPDEKKWYQNPIVIVGGVAVLGLGIYAITRKKK